MTPNTAYLYTPSSSEIISPITINLDVLPIDQLKWEDFEKLCLRLAQEIHGKNNCEIYGTKGQKQHGIDIFAYKDNKYASYQCKRYETVKEINLEDAVKVFKEGKWFDKSDEFFFCTSDALEKTQVQDKFQELKEELSAHNVAFIKWDKIQISNILKDHPQIVYDFFGREWVKAFNGVDFLNQISARRKLDAVQIVEYRKKLFDLYALIFQKYDPSIPASKFGNHTIGIQERFISPDFIEKRITKQYQRTQDINESENERTEPYDEDSQQLKQKGLSLIDYESEVRLNLDDNLAISDRLMILGEPGSGKSTLLRYLVLDLLSEEPKLLNTAKRWGGLLPVWLPFAFITKKLHENENLNLAELLKLWLKSIGQESLYELMDDALNDERLLLIVDGVDEWTNTTVAKLAITKIDIQATIQNATIVYSSRPYGYRMQQDSFQGVKTHTIAEFSIAQQKQFISYWYKKWMEDQRKEDINFVATETNQFLSELQQSNDLLQLSSNPLLLSILISHRFDKATLPKNKVKLLDNITEHLIIDHPRRRRTSANISDETEYDFDMSDIYAVLAKHAHQDHHDGIILKEDACNIIREYLQVEMGYEKAKSKKVSQDILNIGANNIGILIEKSPDEVAFIHRQFQEFMAAKFLITSDTTVIKETLETHSHDPQWSQVIIFLFGLISPRKKQDFKSYLDIVEQKSKGIDHTKLLTYSLGLTLSNAPLSITDHYLTELIEHLEYETHPSKKEALWRVLLSSLYNSKVNEKVLAYLFKYFPNRYNYNDKRLEALEYLSVDRLTDNIRHFLVTSIINGNHNQKLEASKQVRRLISDTWLFNKIMTVLYDCYNPKIIGYLINSLISDDVDRTIKEDIVNRYDHSEHPEVALFTIKLKIHLNIHTDEDLDELIIKQKSISYDYFNEVEKTLIAGWRESEKLYKYLIKSLDQYVSESLIRHELAWYILFKCFNQKEEVVDKIIYQLENKDYPFSHMHNPNGWRVLADNFKDNERLIPVVSEWIKRIYKYRDMWTVHACLLGRTEENKQYLLDQLNEADFSHWQVMALLEGWPNDEKVLEELKAYFRSDNKRRDYASRYISQVFADKKSEGVRIAEGMLFDRDLRRRSRVLPALIELDKAYFEQNLLDKFIKDELPQLNKQSEGYYESVRILIDNFHKHPQVKLLVKNNIFETPIAIIRYYPEMMNDFEEIVSISLPIFDKLRLKFIEELSHRYFSNNKSVVEKFSKFMDEQSLNIRMASAFAYFDHIKDNNHETILERCKELVFFQGESYEIQRQIAFGGYLKLGKLEEYFSLENPSSYYVNKDREERLASPEIHFFDSYLDSNIILSLLIDNFDYIIKTVDGDLSKLSTYGKSNGHNQEYWGFIAKHSDKESCSTPYVHEYINKAESVSNPYFIDFLIRTSSDSRKLEKILIENIDSDNEIMAVKCGKILGELFSEDKEVYKLVREIESVKKHPGKIMALCYGWSSDNILKNIVDEIFRNQMRLNADLAYTIRFMFGKINNILTFFDDIFNNYHEARYKYEFFYLPLLSRVHEDNELRVKIKQMLLTTDSISRKVSFYALLKEVGAIDQDIIAWKQQEILSFEAHRYGYSITENKLTPLIELLKGESNEFTVFS